MGFLKRLFGREPQAGSGTGTIDPDGIYLYVKCNHCGTAVKVRADKKYDLEYDDNGYTWHKTIVDSKCFRRMPTEVHFDRKYAIVSAEIDGGEYISAEAYEAWLAGREAAKTTPDEAESSPAEMEAPGDFEEPE